MPAVRGQRWSHGVTPPTAMTRIAIQEHVDGKVVDLTLRQL
jgi:hypothetical protein